MDLSIIIPTLNESQFIQTTLDRINEMKSGELQIEIILIDAGSKDDTINQVQNKVEYIYQDPTLAGAKFKSLNKGVEFASGNALLFLDADTLLPEKFDLMIHDALSKAKIVGGAFEFGFDKQGLIYRAIEWVNRIRYRIDQRFFGDQALFCTKENFNRVGGYPHEPIMEAAYFCKALRKVGRLALIKSAVLTSARRFEKGHVLKVFLLDTWIWIQFTLGMNIQHYALAYWKENENGDNF